MQPPMPQRGIPKNMVMIAIIAIVAVVIVVLAVILLGSGGSSSTNLVVLSVDDTNVNFMYWTMNGGKVSADVVVKNTGTLAGKGQVRVDVNIGSQFHYSGTKQVPAILPGDQMTLTVDVIVPAVQAAYMGTLYNVETTATIV